MELKRTPKKVENERVANISGTYLDIPDEDIPRLIKAMNANGISSYNAFFRECIANFLIQTKGQQWIAWPPEFVLQDRSNEALVKERWDTAKDKLQGKTKQGKPK